MASTPLPEGTPPALYVDAKGNVWQHGPEAGSFSMARTNPDNEPIPYPLTRYEPVAVQPTAAHEFFADEPDHESMHD